MLNLQNIHVSKTTNTDKDVCADWQSIQKLGALIKLEQARFANRCLTFEPFKEEIISPEQNPFISLSAFVFGPSLSHVCPIIFYYLQLPLNFFSLLAVYQKECFSLSP